jgi:hypothetical protein
MMFRLLAFVALVVSGSVGFFACKPDPDPAANPLVDRAPSIRRIAPQQPAALLLPNDGINLSYKVADNEELASVKLYETRLTNVRYGQDGAVISADTVQGFRRAEIFTKNLTGNQAIVDYLYTVPSSIQTFTRIEIFAQVFDTKGQSEVFGPFVISVDFARQDPLAEYFSILSYEGDTIYNNQSVSRASGFNLIGRRRTNPSNFNNVAAKDIQESTMTTGEFKRALISPNNGVQNVFVVLKPNQFNFEQLTYATMLAAFQSNPQTQETAQLEVGDIVILRMALLHQTYQGAFRNHLAAIRIKDFGPIPGQGDPVGDDDFIRFDYKRSQDVIR